MIENTKNRVSAEIITFKNKIKLDVGGIAYTTLRTTLTSVPGSMLEAMFSGRHAVEEDDEGRVFIDRDGSAFKLVLEFLRSPATFTLEGLSKREVVAVVVEFEYFGLLSPLWTPSPINLNIETSEGCSARIHKANESCQLINFSEGWRWALGSDVLEDGATWKVTIETVSGTNLMCGLISNSSPTLDAYKDPTFNGWFLNDITYVEGVLRRADWPGWLPADEAIFKLDLRSHCLNCFLKRTRQTYQIFLVHTGGWRVCVVSHVGVDVHLSNCTEKENSLME
jgi:hypothetical protein